VEGSCEHGNEPSASIKCWEILVAAQLADSQEQLISTELISYHTEHINAMGKIQCLLILK
jgi:hypothetical protein